MLAKLPAPLRKIILLLKEALAEWREDNASRLAAALSYHTAFSLAPLLVIVLAIAGLFWGAEAVHSQFLAEMRSLIGQDGANFVADMLASASQGDRDIVAMVIGTVTLLLGATGAFIHLHEALNAIWDVPKEKVDSGLSALARGRMISFGMLLTVGFLLLVSLVVSAAVAAMDEFLQGVLPSFQFLTLPAFDQASATSTSEHASLAQLSVANQQSPPAETASLPRWVGVGGLLALVGLTISLWLRQPKQHDYQSLWMESHAPAMKYRCRTMGSGTRLSCASAPRKHIR